MTDGEKQLLAALRAASADGLELTPVERRVLTGCAPRLAQVLGRFGVLAPHPLHNLPHPVRR